MHQFWGRGDRTDRRLLVQALGRRTDDKATLELVASAVLDRDSAVAIAAIQEGNRPGLLNLIQYLRQVKNLAPVLAIKPARFEVGNA